MINVISAMCGSGKSTYIFEQIRNRSMDTKWLYITPFLSEIEDRIPKDLPDHNFKTPSNKKGSKRDDFFELVKKGENIASTHALFKMFTVEIVEAIVEQQYVLVIDEALSAVGTLNSNLKGDDVKALLAGEFVRYKDNPRGRMEWNEEKYPSHKGAYSSIRDMCSLGQLYCYKGAFLMFEYPPELLKGLEEVWVLTYLFHGSPMRCWLDMNTIPYTVLDHEVLGLRKESELKQLVRDNLTLISTRSLDEIQRRQQNKALSSGWFRKAPAEAKEKLKNCMRSAIVQHKVKSRDIFWTTFAGYRKVLQGPGYSVAVGDGGDCFLPCNIRATNDYKHKNFCIYGVNIFMNPIDVKYLQVYGVQVDEDAYSLGEMIQFIFRGCIRDGEPMKLMVLSKRMKKLLEDWLNE